MSNLNLKGIWIPIEILTDDKLSDKEKIIYAIILYLSKENNYCYCTNKTISELLYISVTQVSNLISSLKTKKYIDTKMKTSRNEKVNTNTK
jgi:DNA-binding MarR family transcriptional regulator